jgi:predicted acylesterase/phospholipase RssA
MMASGRVREQSLARARSEKSLARFDRVALVLSGGGALGAYQAGAYAALETAGIRPNWIAGTAIGAVNAVIIAGNLPHERAFRLRQFWRELSRRAALRADAGVGHRVRGVADRLTARWRRPAPAPRETSAIG